MFGQAYVQAEKQQAKVGAGAVGAFYGSLLHGSEAGRKCCLSAGVAQPVNDPALLAPLLKTPDNSHHPPILVLIQNGIGFEDAHRQRHPQVPILSAVTVVNAGQLQPG
ncbi:hypothetical protein PTTG_27550 [Puccinia triticina 1-1 BBBD Race 1]|uniref:Uncharacterized protein n=1 Tax=Puccinia triticina (isolate 1-1 / race 1 (BBBD)) TaxID=630390 RepID=A0A180GJ29_PUCT1|nr:hypothetical protein PTTG_27550 [Puccinia triticina 1-1 BBBD Race 1]